MRKIALAASIATAALALSACGNNSPTAAPTAASVEQPLTATDKAAIDALPQNDLIALVRSGSAGKSAYADERLAKVLAETTDATLVTSVTEYQLPIGTTSRYQANLAKIRLKK